MSSAAEARAALEAARGIQLFDGRSAAWSVLRRGLWAAGGIVAFLALGDGGPVASQALVGFLLAALGTVTPTWWGRRCGTEPRMSPRWVPAVIAVGVYVVLVLVFLVGDVRGALRLALVVALGAGYVLTPLARLVRDRHLADPTSSWPPGAEAFAVLSALEQTHWMHPDRLAVAVDMPAGVTDTWVQSLRSAEALSDGWRSAWGFDRAVAISPAGRNLLHRWRADLEHLAQPWTDSTAPTNPDVSTDRSASDVT